MNLLELLSSVPADRLPGALRAAADLIEMSLPAELEEAEEPAPEPRPRPRRRTRARRRRERREPEEPEATPAQAAIAELVAKGWDLAGIAVQFGFGDAALARWADGGNCSGQTLARLRAAAKHGPPPPSGEPGPTPAVVPEGSAAEVWQ